jgi:uncharacterized protein YciI
MAKNYLLQYAYVPDVLERRDPFRPAHLARFQALKDQGKLVMAGPFQDPVSGAVIVLEAENAGEVYTWAAEDPYVQGGLVHSITVREINVAFKG